VKLIMSAIILFSAKINMKDKIGASRGNNSVIMWVHYYLKY